MTDPGNDPECILTTKPISNTGYGMDWMDGKNTYSHRKAWILVNGPIPKGKFICHKCDVKACINIKHLYLGDRKTNARDAVERGRMATGLRHGTKTHPERIVRGSRKPNAHYSPQQVLEMRLLYSPKAWTLKQLADRFGGTISSVSRVVRGETYLADAMLERARK